MNGDREKSPDMDEKLRNATTLYVGNLYVVFPSREELLAESTQVILHNRRTDPRVVRKVSKVIVHTRFVDVSPMLNIARCGEIKRLIMGLDRYQKTPCGFCFVEYYTHQDALDCMKYIGGTKLDERVIRTDLDEGFAEGRQYGYEFWTLYSIGWVAKSFISRGKSGGQVRDEYRDQYDPGRGGYGRAYAEQFGPEQ